MRKFATAVLKIMGWTSIWSRLLFEAVVLFVFVKVLLLIAGAI